MSENIGFEIRSGHNDLLLQESSHWQQGLVGTFLRYNKPILNRHKDRPDYHNSEPVEECAQSRRGLADILQNCYMPIPDRSRHQRLAGFVQVPGCDKQVLPGSLGRRNRPILFQRMPQLYLEPVRAPDYTRR